jgi:hypothetical protein
MTYRALKDGTRAPLITNRRKPRRPKDDRIHPVGSWEGPPGELERLLAEISRGAMQICCVNLSFVASAPRRV